MEEDRGKMVDKQEPETSNKCGEVFMTLGGLNAHVESYHKGYGSSAFCSFEEFKVDIVYTLFFL